MQQIVVLTGRWSQCMTSWADADVLSFKCTACFSQKARSATRRPRLTTLESRCLEQRSPLFDDRRAGRKWISSLGGRGRTGVVTTAAKRNPSLNLVMITRSVDTGAAAKEATMSQLAGLSTKT